MMAVVLEGHLIPQWLQMPTLILLAPGSRTPWCRVPPGFGPLSAGAGRGKGWRLVPMSDAPIVAIPTVYNGQQFRKLVASSVAFLVFMEVRP